MHNFARASARIYEILLLAYPPQFRRTYGAEMASVFSENCRYACHSRGPYAVIGLWLSTLQDLLISASAEHISCFLCRTKSDVRAVWRAPMFVAATGALVGALFFISTSFVRTIFFHEAASLRQFNSIAIAGVNIASVWLTSGFALFFLRQRRAHMLFLSRLQAFNHLACISLLLALAAILKYAFSDARFQGFSLQSLSNPQRWFVFPLVLVCTVSSIILLDPILTLRPSEGKCSSRNPAVRMSGLRLSLVNSSDEHKLREDTSNAGTARS